MTTTAPPDPSAELRGLLVDRLEGLGYLSSAWREAFLETRRETFVQTFVVREQGEKITYRASSDGYLKAVYGDASLVTLHDAAGTATSASSQPSVMAAMLTALGDLPRNARVLEIGTGTGYNTALLCHKVGDHAVTSIEVDPRLTGHARESLMIAGYRPTLLVGDGTKGYRDPAPYDALIATCSVHRVPLDWLRQVRPGGVIVVNVGHALISLRVQEEGGAIGPLLSTMAAFMVARPTADATAPTASRDAGALLARKGKRTTAAVPDLAGDMPQLLRLLMQPDVHQVTLRTREADPVTFHCLTHEPTGSWARIEPQGAGVVHVDYDGERDLFGEFAALLSHWAQMNRPGPGHYGLSILPNNARHELWFETPDGPRWRLP